MKINPIRLALIPALALALTQASLLTAKESPANATYLDPGSIQFKQILPPMPAPGSDEEKADLAKFAEVRASRTPQDVERATREQTDSVFDFAESLGSGFTADKLPKTAELFDEITQDAKIDVKAAKKAFQRPRPTTPEADADDSKGNDKYSYPSGHSTRAYLWATLLAQLFPEQKDALLKIAARKAWDRVVLGKHFPADVKAGQVYGEFLANELLKNTAFQKKWQPVQQEIDTFKAGQSGKAARIRSGQRKLLLSNFEPMECPQIPNWMAGAPRVA